MQLFTPYQYLKIAVANAYGLDKESWDTRIHWFDQNQSQMGKLVSEAEEPVMMVAALNAIEKAHNKIPSGFPISLDATASGIQLLSVLTGDIDAAKLCNVINTGRREDAYTNIYQSMMDELGEEGQITRADTKKAIMTLN